MVDYKFRGKSKVSGKLVYGMSDTNRYLDRYSSEEISILDEAVFLEKYNNHIPRILTVIELNYNSEEPASTVQVSITENTVFEKLLEVYKTEEYKYYQNYKNASVKSAINNRTLEVYAWINHELKLVWKNDKQSSIYVIPNN